MIRYGLYVLMLSYLFVAKLSGCGTFGGNPESAVSEEFHLAGKDTRAFANDSEQDRFSLRVVVSGGRPELEVDALYLRFAEVALRDENEAWHPVEGLFTEPIELTALAAGNRVMLGGLNNIPAAGVDRLRLILAPIEPEEDALIKALLDGKKIDIQHDENTQKLYFDVVELADDSGVQTLHVVFDMIRSIVAEPFGPPVPPGNGNPGKGNPLSLTKDQWQFVPVARMVLEESTGSIVAHGFKGVREVCLFAVDEQGSVDDGCQNAYATAIPNEAGQVSFSFVPAGEYFLRGLYGAVLRPRDGPAFPVVVETLTEVTRR